MPKTLSTDEYLLRVRQKIDALKARTRRAGYFDSAGTQLGEIRSYFANRAVQIGEACFRISELEIPLLILARVLCEDLLRLFWASQSDKNAAEFEKLAVSEMTRILRVNLTGGRARLRKKSSGADVTKEFLPKLGDFITNRKHIESMAKEAGLSKLYDVIYRFGSLSPHASTLGLESKSAETSPIRAALSAISGLLGVMTTILDGPIPTAEEVLDRLGLGKIGGQ